VAGSAARPVVEDRRQRAVRLGAWSLAIGAGLTVIGVMLATALGWASALDRCCTPVGYLGGGLQAGLHLLVLGGFIALWVSGVCGRGRLALAGVALVCTGTFLQAPAEVVFRLAPRLATPLYAIAAPLNATGLIMAGIAAFRAGLWRRWQSATVLAAGLYLPLIQVPSFVLARGPNPIAIAGWHLLAVGIAVALLKGAIAQPSGEQVPGRPGGRRPEVGGLAANPTSRTGQAPGEVA